MLGPSFDPGSPLGRLLQKARDLAQEVRRTADRVHEEAKEAHRLTEVSRRHSERGRQLSETGRQEARAIKTSITWNLDTAHKAARHLIGKMED
jgi:hypothetical protein